MRVRSLRALGLISVCTMVPLACTSILGDYKIGSAGPASEAGTDGLLAQETSVMDVANDGPADASAYVKLTCSEVMTSRVLLGSFTSNNGPDRIWALPRPRNVIRAVVPDNGGGGTHIYTFTTDMSSTPRVTESTLLERFMSVKSYPGGIAALIQSSVSLADGGQSPILKIIKLPDGSQVWSPGLPVTAPGDLDCQNRLGATFEIVDEATDNYLLAFAYSVGNGPGCTPGNPPRIFGRHQKGLNGVTTEWTLPPVALANGNTGVEFLNESIAIDIGDVYVVVNANGSGGPPAAGSAPAVYKTGFDMNSVAPGTFALKSQSDFMFGVAFAPGQQAQTMNLGFLEADLGSATATPEMYVGHSPAASVVGLQPSTALATTVLPGLADLIVDKARFHWQNFRSPSSENLIGIGPQLIPGATGANFMWWDGEGRVRAQRTGTMTNLLAGESIYGVDAVFSSPPLIQIADLEVIFSKKSADASPNVIDVWATDVSCLKL